MGKILVKGFVFLIPILGIVLIIIKFVQFVVSVLHPFSSKIGIKGFVGEVLMILVSVVFLLFSVLFLGWISRFSFAIKTQNYLEDKIFLIFPPLSFLKMNALSLFSEDENPCVMVKRRRFLGERFCHRGKRCVDQYLHSWNS